MGVCSEATLLKLLVSPFVEGADVISPLCFVKQLCTSCSSSKKPGVGGTLEPTPAAAAEWNGGG